MRHNQRGFTIVELMIATVIFSIVLLVISAALLQVGRLYYKGVTASRTQSVARTIMSDITQAIQFNSGNPVPSLMANGAENTALNNPAGPATPTTSRSICVATIQYSYILGQQVKGTTRGMVRNTVPAGCSSSLAQNINGATVSGTEMLGENMRLSNFVVQPITGSTDSYRVIVRVVYGDNDLLCSPSVNPTTCNSVSVNLTTAQLAAARDLQCKNVRSGTQFCATAELSTIVERRL